MIPSPRPALSDLLAHGRLDLGRRFPNVDQRLRELCGVFPLQCFEILQRRGNRERLAALAPLIEVAGERSPDRGVVAERLGPGGDGRDGLRMAFHGDITLSAGAKFDKAYRPRIGYSLPDAKITPRRLEAFERAWRRISLAERAKGFVDRERQPSVARNATKLDRQERP
jgi:hypothetical protein